MTLIFKIQRKAMWNMGCENRHNGYKLLVQFYSYMKKIRLRTVIFLEARCPFTPLEKIVEIRKKELLRHKAFTTLRKL
jgi:hypothetical protein